jgi:Glycosyl hydrolase family 81 C-terminal domain
VNGTAPDPAGYETEWGGVVSKLGANNSNIDFGNGYYNDHRKPYTLSLSPLPSPSLSFCLTIILVQTFTMDIIYTVHL